MKRIREVIFLPASELLGRETQNANVSEAVAPIGFQVNKWIGTLLTIVSGPNKLVFADGVGGHEALAARVSGVIETALRT